MKQRPTLTQRALDKLVLPRTRIIYEALGAPEPEAWKWIILSMMPTSLLLLPSVALDIETVPAIAEYPNIINSAIGLCLFLGSCSVLAAWWLPRDVTQAWRVRQEIRGLYFISGGLLCLATCGAPTVIRAVFTFFVSIGCFLGAVARLYALTRTYPNLLKEAQHDPR